MKSENINWVKIAAISCIVVCIADFIVLFFLGSYYPGYDQLKNTMSSLGASASPVSNIISLWWIFIGIVFVCFGFHFRKAFNSHDNNVKMVSALIILYGLGEGIGSGVFKANTLGEGMSNTYLLHGIASGVGSVAALLLPLFMNSVISRKEAPYFYRFSGIVFVIGLITMVLFTFRFSSDENNFIRLYRGLWQRFFLLNLYVYLITISTIILQKKRIVNFHHTKK